MLLSTIFMTLLAQAPAKTVYIDANDASAVQTLAQMPTTVSVELEGIYSMNGEETLILQLERFRVFKPDAQVVVHTDHGDSIQAVPDNAYFRGRLLGDPFSNAFLAIHEDGSAFGVVNALDRKWAMAGAPGQALIARDVTEMDSFGQQGAFACGFDDLIHPAPQPQDLGLEVRQHVEKRGGGNYQVTVAAETDFEYYSIFGDTTDATNYIGDLIGYSSTIYLAELNTEMVVGSVSLWTTAADPWTQSAANCLLYQFGKYWNDNNPGVARSTTHMFSGRASLSGIAWVGVLCNGAFSTDITGSGCPLPAIDNYGGNYGVTMGLSGTFDINNPMAMWDIYAVAHEIGHNFNSPHTHCYAGLGGNPNPIDQCFGTQIGAGCYSGAASLPCGVPGGGCGTIMSYCHLLGGGDANISLTLGLGHPFGVAPERVPTRMGDHVAARSASFPACLPFVMGGPGIFSDGFESGNTSAWTVTVPKRSSLQVNAAAALVETRGLEVSVSDTSLAYVEDRTPSGETTYRLSLRFDPNTLNYPVGENFYLVDVKDVGNISRMGLQYSANNGHRLRLFAREDSNVLTESPWFIAPNGDQELELEWRQSSAPGANDGTAIFHLDGALKTALDCLDSDAVVISATAIGASRGIETGGSGSLYLDQFASFNDSALTFQVPVLNYSQWPLPQEVPDFVALINSYRCLN